VAVCVLQELEKLSGRDESPGSTPSLNMQGEAKYISSSQV
jgi:hypothetical protein